MSLPTLGFIGTGTIASALVKGFCRSDAPACPMLLSPRNAEKAAALRAAFPDRVTVSDSMQQVADGADVVFVAVLPKAAEEVYTTVRFRREQTVINLVMGCPLTRIRAWIGETENLVHIIPMAFVAEVPGPIVLYPENAYVRALLTPLGEIVAAGTQAQMKTLQQITGLGASFDTLLRDTVLWGMREGLDERTAVSYTAAFFAALAQQAGAGPFRRLAALAEEFTPGGLNWKGKTTIEEAGAFRPWTDALEEIKKQNNR